MDGQTVRQFLASANIVLGGGSGSGLTADGADTVASLIAEAFLNGVPTSFAQTSLFVGGCTP